MQVVQFVGPEEFPYATEIGVEFEASTGQVTDSVILVVFTDVGIVKLHPVGGLVSALPHPPPPLLTVLPPS